MSAELLKRLADAEHDARLWKAIATRDDGDLRAMVHERGVEIGLKCAALRALAAEARVMLEISNAPNYVELGLRDDKGHMVVTIQRREGKTPHDLKVQAEQELAEVKAHLDRVVSDYVRATR